MSTAPASVRRHKAPARLQLTWPAAAAMVVIALIVGVLVDRIVVSGSSAGTGNGIPATQARSLPPFTGVDLAGDNNVTVRVGGRQSVVVHADSNLLARVTTQVRSGRLVIGTTPGNLNAKAPMFVSVSVPTLGAIVIHGAGNIAVTGINSRRLAVAMPGSGVISAAGSTTQLAVTISGEGTALLGRLTARDANAGVSGDGSITLTATHSLDARISGSGTILYGGSPPHLNTSVTGSGTITPG